MTWCSRFFRKEVSMPKDVADWLDARPRADRTRLGVCRMIFEGVPALPKYSGTRGCSVRASRRSFLFIQHRFQLAVRST